MSRTVLSLGRTFVWIASSVVFTACSGPVGTDHDGSSDGSSDGSDVTILPDGAVEPAAETALRTGVVGAATEAQLCAVVRADLAAARSHRFAIWSSIYDTGPAGEISAATLTDFTWSLSHDSMVLESRDDERNVPIIVANDQQASGMPHRSVLGLAGEAGSWRYVALGTNGLADLEVTPPAAASPEAHMESVFAHAIRWLTRDMPAGGAGLHVVTAQLANNTWWHHETGTASFFARNFSGAVLNAANACDGASLPACLDGAGLLVIGADDGTQDDHQHMPPDLAAIDRALDMAIARNIPVLYVPAYRDENAMNVLVHRRMRIGVDTNYWNIERVTHGTPADLTGRVFPLDAVATMVGTVCDGSLTTSDYAACLAGGSDEANTLRSCDAASFHTKLLDGLEVMRATSNALDADPTDPFGADGYRIPRGLFLLGDLYRAGGNGTPAIRYPVASFTDAPSFARAAFADSSMHLAHATNRAAADLGTYGCTRDVLMTGACRPYDPAAAQTADATVSATVRPNDVWTSTGRYAVAGRAFHLRRTDNVTARVWARVGFAREGTTRVFEGSATRSNYDRPQYLASPWIELTAGRDTTLSSPIGGPIYLRTEASAASAGMTATIETHGTGAHAALLEATPAAAMAFVHDVMVNPFPHVDMRLTGFEIHLRRDKFLETVSGSTHIADRGDGSEYSVAYSGDVGRVVDHVQNQYVGQVYGLAGFAAPVHTLTETLSPDVQAICGTLGWSCTDATIHARDTIQHANYDEYANCGDGCSGNPFDADWSIVPLGWGESHELGHNLQTGHLNVHYATAADRNDWSRWSDRSGEVSNNIFPYHTLWQFVRVAQHETGVVNSRVMFKPMFAAAQSQRAALVSTVMGASRRVVFDEMCNVLADAPATSTDDLLPEAVWADGGYAAQNSLRMAFYIGLPIRMQGRTVQGRALSNGWDIFTLLYEQTRLFDRAAHDVTTWAAGRAALGFDRFAYDSLPTYGGRTVRDIPGNDFMVVAISFLAGVDARPYFRDHGVRISDLADAQVQAHVDAGRATGVLGGDMVVFDGELPPADLASTRVALDGTATWPRDGWHPSRCVH